MSVNSNLLSILCYFHLYYVINGLQLPTIKFKSSIMLSWINNNNITQTLILYNILQQNINTLQKIDNIPYAYQIIGNCQILSSSNISSIFSIKQSLSIITFSYHYFLNNKIIKKGQNVTSLEYLDSLPFKIINHPKLIHNKMFLEYQNNLYSFNPSIYSQEPRCYFLSNVDYQTVCQIGCRIQTPLSLFNKKMIKLQNYTINLDTNRELVLKDSLNNNSQFFQIKLDITNYSNLSLAQLKINNQSIVLKSFISYIQPNNYLLMVILKNTLIQNTFSIFQIKSKSIIILQRQLFFEPKEVINIQINLESQKDISLTLFNDLKSGQTITPSYWSNTQYSQNQSTLTDTNEQQISNQSIQLNVGVIMIIIIVIGGICLCVLLILFIWILSRWHKSQQITKDIQIQIPASSSRKINNPQQQQQQQKQIGVEKKGIKHQQDLQTNYHSKPGTLQSFSNTSLPVIAGTTPALPNPKNL